MNRQVYRLVGLTVVVTLVLLAAGACGAAEEPTPTATARPPTPTPTARAVTPATPTPTAARVVATPAPTSTPTPAPAAAKRGGTLNIRVTSQLNSMDPMQQKTGDPWQLSPVFNGLTRLDPGLTLLPGLAKSWEATPTSITFHLQAGVKFHDGTDFNAQAVKLNIERTTDPVVKSLQAVYLGDISTVEAVDPLTVRFTMKQPNAVLLTYLADRPGMISSPKAFGAASLSDYSRKSVGTGPFKLAEWVNDSHLIYERYADYWEKGLPYLDRILAKIIPDPSVGIAALRAGDVDQTPITGEQYQLLEKDKSLVLFSGPCTCSTDFHVHRNKKPTDDARVRRAISMALDRDALVRTLVAGLGRPLYGPIDPGFTWVFRPDLKKNGYDPAGARKLLAEAGYANGFTLGPVVYYGASNRRYVQAYGGMLKEVGITLDLLEMEASQASLGYQVEHKYAAYGSGFSPHSDPSVSFVERYYPGSPKNVGNTIFPGFKDAIDKANATYDQRERAKLLQQAEDILVDQMALIWAFSADRTEAWRKTLKGYEPHAASLPYFGEIWLDR